MNNNIDNRDIAPEALTDGDRDTPFPVVLEITLDDVLIQNEARLFADDTSQQLMIKVMQGMKLTSRTFFPKARKWVNGRKPGAQ
jgi:hypothetical protein